MLLWAAELGFGTLGSSSEQMYLICIFLRHTRCSENPEYVAVRAPGHGQQMALSFTLAVSAGVPPVDLGPKRLDNIALGTHNRVSVCGVLGAIYDGTPVARN